MTTLTIRISEEHKNNLDAAALKAGYTRLKDGELGGNISTLLVLLAKSLPDKTPEEIQRFLTDRPQ